MVYGILVQSVQVNFKKKKYKTNNLLIIIFKGCNYPKVRERFMGADTRIFEFRWKYFTSKKALFG